MNRIEDGIDTLEAVPLDAIVEGERFRRDMGDINALAQSIKDIGLLQPIGIDDENRLVFGGRRLAAFRLLGRTHIPARRVNLEDIILGEFAENELRKDFTVSERVAIAKAIEQRLAGRVGNPNLRANGGNFSTIEEHGKSRDLAAEKAGFGSGRTYEAAKKAVETLPPPLVDALDDGRLSVHLAAQVAKLPEEDIDVIAEAPPEAVRDTAQKVVKAHVAHNSGENEWYTPPEFIDAARRVMGGIDLDPASCALANEWVKATKFFTKEDDGRAQFWHGRVWMNPPYAQPLIQDFAEAVSDKADRGEIEQACVLVNNATETAWFQRMLRSAKAVCFPARRIRFIGVEGEKGTPLQGQAFLYFGRNVSAFVAEFSAFGEVLVKP